MEGELTEKRREVSTEPVENEEQDMYMYVDTLMFPFFLFPPQMIQMSAEEEESLVSQKTEYEKVLAQQRQLYEEKTTELDKLHSQRKVSELPLSPVLCSMCDVYTSQEYEAELEMLQEQKKTYEEKMEDYRALQQQKKVKMQVLL